MRKKIWCILLIAVMVLNLLPISAMAVDAEAATEEVVQIGEGNAPSGEQPNEGQNAEDKLSSDDQQAEALFSSEVGEMTKAAEEEEKQQNDQQSEGLLSAEALSVDGLEANEAVKYIDENTETITGTYTLKGNVKNEHRLKVQGSATIELPKGMTLELPRGIHVASGNTLTITGEGTLIAHAESENAGIGGDSSDRCGDIIISDGTVRATGGYCAAGIGGGKNGAGGNITISGGIVTAFGGTYAAGIGGGQKGDGSRTTISGGTVTTTGGRWGAGIGGGQKGDGSRTTISGGTVTATGGDLGAGIGGGEEGAGGMIIISGGTVTANGGDRAAGIGGGDKGAGGGVRITGGTVTATGGRWGAGIGGGQKGDGGTTIISGGTVTATGGGSCSAIGRGMSVSGTMGTFQAENGLNVINIVNSNVPIQIDDPNGVKLDGITKVFIGKKIGNPIVVTGLIYNGKEQNGCVNASQQHTLFGGRLSAVNAGTYTFTVTPEDGYQWMVGSIPDSKRLISWEIAPKDVSTTRQPVTQNVSKGVGELTAPGDFHDSETDEDIPGTLTYTYNGAQMTQEAIEAELAKLPVDSRGTIDWSYTAGGNFTGIIRGSINYVIRGIEFTVNGKPADHTNAVTIKENPIYGDTWAEIVTIKEKDIIASVNGVKGNGRYFLNVEGTPNAGEQDYAVMFTGRVGPIRYNDVTVYSGKVNIAKADYADVIKTASAEVEYKVDSSVVITLPDIPRGASYGMPQKAKATNLYVLSQEVINSKVVFAFMNAPEGTEPMVFTVPVIPDDNHNGYAITVTVSKAVPKVAAAPTAAEGITYNGKDQNGVADGGEHVTLTGTLTAANAGEHTFTATPEAGFTWEDGSVEPKLCTWKIAAKDVSTTRQPVTQNVSKGVGELTAPGDFHDSETDEDIPGILTYTYNGSQMTQEAIEAELAKLPVDSRGTIDWSYTAGGNFTGIIRGSINFLIRGIEFTVNGKPADHTNAVLIKKNPTYGDTWADIVKINGNNIIASVNGVKGSGLYTLNVSGIPGAGEQDYAVMFTGRVGPIRYNDVTVYSGKVNIAKAEYADVIKTASAEVEHKADSSVVITLPDIPQGAGYGTPRKEVEGKPYELSDITGNEITFTLTENLSGGESMAFIVPVIPDDNHKGYDIFVTVNVIQPVEKKITVNVTTTSRYLPLIRMYQADISVEATGTTIDKVEHSDLGFIYTIGQQKTSLFPINHFFIRVTEEDGTIHVYEYKNGLVSETKS